MAKINYKVTLDLNSISYEIKANDPDEAEQIAYEYALQETQYDLLKWANYQTEELING